MRFGVREMPSSITRSPWMHAGQPQRGSVHLRRASQLGFAAHLFSLRAQEYSCITWACGALNGIAIVRSSAQRALAWTVRSRQERCSQRGESLQDGHQLCWGRRPFPTQKQVREKPEALARNFPCSFTANSLIWRNKFPAIAARELWR